MEVLDWGRVLTILIILAPAITILSFLRKKVPFFFSILFLIISLFNVVCIWAGLFQRFEHIDSLAHFLTSFALVPCFTYLLLNPMRHHMGRYPLVLGLIGFCIGLGVGSAWEVLEYILKAQAGYADTISDLVFDGAGAAFASILMIWRFNRDNSRLTLITGSGS